MIIKYFKSGNLANFFETESRIFSLLKFVKMFKIDVCELKINK